MVRVVLSILALFASLTLLVSGSSMLGTLLSMRLSLEHFDAAAIGVIMAFYSLGFVIGTLRAPRVIRRVGHIRAFSAFSAIACASVLLHPIYVNGSFWAVLRVITGFSVAGLMTVIESWVNTRATNETRGRLLSLYMLIFYSAAAAGQFMIGLGHPMGFALFSLVAVLMVLSAVPLSLTRAEAPLLVEVERLPLRKLYRISPSGLAGALVTGIVVSDFLALGPIYATRSGLSVSRVSIFMGVAVFGAMVLQWPAGRLADRYDRRRVLIGLTALAAVASLAAGLFGGYSDAVLFPLAAVFMGLASSMYPVSVAITNDFMETEQVVNASAGLLLSYGVGTCIGPVAGAVSMRAVGPAGLFLFSAACLVFLALLVRLQMRRYASVAVADQGEYVTMPAASTPALTELDPRNEGFDEHMEAAESAQEEPLPPEQPPPDIDLPRDSGAAGGPQPLQPPEAAVAQPGEGPGQEPGEQRHEP
ncbi:MAG TPA: MFS transporter [Gammaproteobacteria bacterium]|nr:MFS transporter [Gammaproteobacteria bacterium]